MAGATIGAGARVVATRWSCRARRSSAGAVDRSDPIVGPGASVGEGARARSLDHHRRRRSDRSRCTNCDERPRPEPTATDAHARHRRCRIHRLDVGRSAPRRGPSVDVIDNLWTGKLANLAASQRRPRRDRARDPHVDIRDPSIVELIAGRPARGRLPPRGPGRRAGVGQPSRVRRGGQRHRQPARARGCTARRRPQGRRGIERRHDLRRAAPEELPVDETHPQHPVSPYGVTKKVVDDYLYAYRALHELDFTALALANVYGPRQDPHGEAGVVAIFAGKLLAGSRARSSATASRPATSCSSTTSSTRSCGPPTRWRAADQHRHRRRDVGERAVRSMADGRRRRPLARAARPSTPGELDRSSLAIHRCAGTSWSWQPRHRSSTTGCATCSTGSAPTPLATSRLRRERVSGRGLRRGDARVSVHVAVAEPLRIDAAHDRDR